jgi:hypothetical protein
VYFVKEEEDEEGKKSKKTIQLVPYDLFVVDLLEDGERPLGSHGRCASRRRADAELPTEVCCQQGRDAQVACQSEHRVHLCGHDKTACMSMCVLV